MKVQKFNSVFIHVLLIIALIVNNCQCAPEANETVIYKCCMIGEVLDMENSDCMNDTSLTGDYNSKRSQVEEVFRRRFKHLRGQFYEHFKVVPRDNWCRVDQNVILYFEHDNIKLSNDGKFSWGDSAGKELQQENYCLDLDNGTMVAVTCQDEYEHGINHHLNKLGMLISIPFLFATLVVNLILPDKKVQIKCLMAYITCLMMSCISIVYLQFNSNLPGSTCKTIASIGVYFFVATFCWMNVTCIDMFLTFSGKRMPIRGNSSKWKRFAVYCTFANGGPLILLALIYGLNTLNDFPGHPRFGIDRCWIANGLPELLYFYGPVAILLTVNIIFFSITAHTIRTTMRDNKKMLRSKESQRHCESNKQDYVLYIKLFIAMGINWSMELISWLVDWCLGPNKVSWIWYPTDFCNAIYGIFIFIVFVCKRNVWVKLKQRYYVCVGKPNMARALDTRASGYQTSHTERTNLDDMSESNNYSQIKLERM